MSSMASSRNRMDRRDRKLRRRRFGMRVDDSARRLAMIRAARLKGRPDTSQGVTAGVDGAALPAAPASTLPPTPSHSATPNAISATM